jgi:hypothetical protein
MHFHGHGVSTLKGNSMGHFLGHMVHLSGLEHSHSMVPQMIDLRSYPYFVALSALINLPDGSTSPAAPTPLEGPRYHRTPPKKNET